MKEQRVLTSCLSEFVGEQVFVKGRVISIREVGAVRFMDILDRSGRVQILLGDNCVAPDLQSIISCRGIVKSSSKALSGLEIHSSEICEIAAPQSH